MDGNKLWGCIAITELCIGSFGQMIGIGCPYQIKNLTELGRRGSVTAVNPYFNIKAGWLSTITLAKQYWVSLTKFKDMPESYLSELTV